MKESLFDKYLHEGMSGEQEGYLLTADMLRADQKIKEGNSRLITLISLPFIIGGILSINSFRQIDENRELPIAPASSVCDTLKLNDQTDLNEINPIK